MPTIKRRAAGGNARRSRTNSRTSPASASKGENLTPASFPGSGAIAGARRKIAKGAGKVNPNLNRKLA